MQRIQIIHDLTVRLSRKRKKSLTAILFTLFITALNSSPARAGVVEFSGGPSTTTTDSEIFFSPTTGSVSNSFSADAAFGVGNVSGNQAIVFNLIPDGNFVVSPDPLGPAISSVARLGSGVAIGSGNSFDNTELTLAESIGTLGNWNQLGSGFIGLEFGTGSDVHYGWADISVDPGYNVTLNSFAYDTVAGEAITTPAPAAVAPEPSSVLLFSLAGLGAILFGGIRRRKKSLAVAAAAVPLLLAGSVSSLSAQTVPGQTDPVAGRLMQFRSDQLFNISADPSMTQTNLSTFDTTVSDNSFNLTVADTNHSSTNPWSTGRQYHSASGRFLTPEHDDVVVVYGDGSNVDVQVAGHPELNMTLPNLMPRYVQTLANGSIHPTADWISVTSGDLDHLTDTSGNYHDEVVIAYVMNDGTYRVVVLDFSRSVIDPMSGQLQTQLPKVATYDGMDGVKFSPSIMNGPSVPPLFKANSVLPDDNLVSVAVGNFEGDGTSQIALGAVTAATGENIQTLRYRGEVAALFEVSNQQIPTPSLNDIGAIFKAVTGANVGLAAGDFEGRGVADLAAASLLWNSFPNSSNNNIMVQGAVSILKSSTQSLSMNMSVYSGNPTRLWFSDNLGAVGRVPRQITISGATGAWQRLNGTWPTTFNYFNINGSHIGIEIPVDTSDIPPGTNGATSVPMTVVFSNGLGSIPDSAPTLVPKSAYLMPFTTPEAYPKFRLLSGLFKYDPANGFDFSRRQIGVVWNEPGGGEIGVSWYSIGDDATGTPQFAMDGSLNIGAPVNGSMPQHSFDATAGAFRGNTLALNPDRTASSVATWPIVVNAWYNNSQQMLYAIDAGASGSLVTVQSNNTASYDPQQRFSLVNYDADGKSLYLGAPVHISTSAFYTPTIMLEEPPKHSAWLDVDGTGQKIFNLNRNDGFNIQFQSTQEQELSGSTQSQSSSTTTSLDTISAGLSVNLEFPFGIGNKTSIQDTYKMGSDVENTSSYYNSSSSKISYSQMAETDHDDYLRGQTQDVNVWRYRVYGANSGSTTGNLYFDLAYPSSPYDASTSGSSLDWYNPIHENGNLLSYPPRPSSGLPDDVGGAYTVNNQVPPNVSNGVLFANSGWCFGGDSGSKSVTMAGVTSSSDTVGWTKTNSWDNDLQISDTLTLKAVEINGSFDADWGQKQSLSATTSSNNTLSGSTSVTYNLDDGDATQGYNIFPVLYNSNAGVLKFINYVSIPTAASTGQCSSGGSFWTRHYGGAPDPAFNLPNRFSFSGYNKGTDTTTWNLQTALEREKLRGFFVTSATANPIESTGDNPVYDSVSINPKVGSTVRLAVRVYNYSIGQPAGNIDVKFWAMPWDSSKDNELACGAPGTIETGRHCAPNVRTYLGDSQIASIPAWGAGGQNWTLAALNWQIPSDFITRFNTPEFRIYVTLDYAAPSLNPAQNPCNNSPANNPQPCPAYMITDTSDPKYDPNAPGQNKEGYGSITLQANTLQRVPPGGGPLYSKVHTDGDSLMAVGADGKLKRGFVVAYLGRSLSLRVKAVAENADNQNQQKVLVFEGSQKNQTLIAGKTLQGVSTKGTAAWFNWTPTALGLHQLTAELLEPNNQIQQEKGTAKLSVVVVRLPGDVNGDGVVDARDTALISQEIGKTVKESSCGSACDLNGNGVIDRGDLDMAMAHCDRNYCTATPVIEGKRMAATTGNKEVKQ